MEKTSIKVALFICMILVIPSAWAVETPDDIQVIIGTEYGGSLINTQSSDDVYYNLQPNPDVEPALDVRPLYASAPLAPNLPWTFTFEYNYSGSNVHNLSVFNSTDWVYLGNNSAGTGNYEIITTGLSDWMVGETITTRIYGFDNETSIQNVTIDYLAVSVDCSLTANYTQVQNSICDDVVTNGYYWNTSGYNLTIADTLIVNGTGEFIADSGTVYLESVAVTGDPNFYDLDITGTNTFNSDFTVNDDIIGTTRTTDILDLAENITVDLGTTTSVDNVQFKSRDGYNNVTISGTNSANKAQIGSTTDLFGSIAYNIVSQEENDQSTPAGDTWQTFTVDDTYYLKDVELLFGFASDTFKVSIELNGVELVSDTQKVNVASSDYDWQTFELPVTLTSGNTYTINISDEEFGGYSNIRYHIGSDDYANGRMSTGPAYDMTFKLFGSEELIAPDTTYLEFLDIDTNMSWYNDTLNIKDNVTLSELYVISDATLSMTSDATVHNYSTLETLTAFTLSGTINGSGSNKTKFDDVTITGTFDAPTTTEVIGNLTSSGTITTNSGTFDFSGTESRILSAETFAKILASGTLYVDASPTYDSMNVTGTLYYNVNHTDNTKYYYKSGDGEVNVVSGYLLTSNYCYYNDVKIEDNTTGSSYYVDSGSWITVGWGTPTISDVYHTSYLHYGEDETVLAIINDPQDFQVQLHVCNSTNINGSGCMDTTLCNSSFEAEGTLNCTFTTTSAMLGDNTLYIVAVNNASTNSTYQNVSMFVANAGPTFNTMVTDPTTVNYGDEFYFLINSTDLDDDDTVTMNLTLTYPNASTYSEDLSATGDLFNTSNFTINEYGEYSFLFTSTDGQYTNTNTTVLNYSLGTLTYTPSQIQKAELPGDSEVWNISLSHTGAITDIINVSSTGDFPNATLGLNSSLSADQINVSASTTEYLTLTFNTSGTTVGTYYQNVTLTRRDGSENVIPITITVAGSVADIVLSPQAKSLSMYNTDYSTWLLTVANNGNYDATGCNISFTGTVATISSVYSNPESFTVTAGTSSEYIIVHDTPATATYTGSISVTCVASASGAIDQDFVNPFTVTVTQEGDQGDSGGGGGGGGSIIIRAPRAEDIEQKCGDGICQVGELDSCPTDCGFNLKQTLSTPWAIFLGMSAMGFMVYRGMSDSYLKRKAVKRYTPSKATSGRR